MLVTGTNVQTIRKSLKNKVDTLSDDLVVAIWTLLDNPGMHEQSWQDPLKKPDNTNEFGVAEKRAAYQRLLKYKGTLHHEIDCKKELAEWRDEKFNRTN
jgi:hypothetical protein